MDNGGPPAPDDHAAGTAPPAVVLAVLERGFEGDDVVELVARNPAYAAAICRRVDADRAAGRERNGGWLRRALEAGDWKTMAAPAARPGQTVQDVIAGWPPGLTPPGGVPAPQRPPRLLGESEYADMMAALALPREEGAAAPEGAAS